MWERFSYFGMASLLVLYLVKYLLLPGQAEAVLGYRAVKAALESLFGPLEPQPLASQIFGFYTGLAYLTPILGGYLADRVLGQRTTAVLGACLMAAGHFLMAFEALLFVALGLPDPRDRRVQAECLDAGRLALRAGRRAPGARLFDLLCRHQYRGVPGAAGLPARSAARSAGTTASRQPASACWSGPRSMSSACAGFRRTNCIARAPRRAPQNRSARANGAPSSACLVSSRS